MNEYKLKISDIIKMFEIIYSNRDAYGIGLIRLWSLKKMKDKVKSYQAIFDFPNSEKYVTKSMMREIDNTYDIFSTIIKSKQV